VQYPLGGSQRDYTGFFDLATSIHHLIAHKHRNQGVSSTSRPKYMGYRGDKGKGRGGSPEKGAEQPIIKKRKVQESKTSKGKEEKVERFDIGQRIYYFNDEPGNEKWHSARVIGYLYPGDESYADTHSNGQREVIYKIQPDNEQGQRYKPITQFDWEGTSGRGTGLNHV
jgi:hypothetical protein